MKTAKIFEEKKVRHINSVSTRDEFHQRHETRRSDLCYSTIDLFKIIVNKGIEADEMRWNISQLQNENQDLERKINEQIAMKDIHSITLEDKKSAENSKPLDDYRVCCLELGKDLVEVKARYEDERKSMQWEMEKIFCKNRAVKEDINILQSREVEAEKKYQLKVGLFNHWRRRSACQNTQKKRVGKK